MPPPYFSISLLSSTHLDDGDDGGGDGDDDGGGDGGDEDEDEDEDEDTQPTSDPRRQAGTRICQCPCTPPQSWCTSGSSC